VRQKIADFFQDKYLFAGLDYSGHAPIAAALATIETYEEEGYLKIQKVAAYLGESAVWSS
jgi:adenosylmethionine-8-amino-7-oxononanoate aminotransferase